MIHREEIANKIISLIAGQLTISKDIITEESTLDSLGADSLDRFEFVMKLEEEFGVTINDEDADKIVTVGQAIDYIYTLKQEQERRL